ncbi:MAG: pyridoxamine 5'-phosphate oxidase family protein [bacterium]|nr:pyridoxamine 5'-phosphate oxidase family protein [bacterium]MCM1375046.1 pyridoxamine 5'-phosphate oxidase family protein [Muribaculum sp.]
MTLEEINDLVKKAGSAGLGFLDGEGNPSIRQVFSTWHKGLGVHYISTNTSSMHVQALLKNDRACLYFVDCTAFEGVCLAGKVTVHFEREYRELLWNEGDERYYPGGVEDEDYCVLEFRADHGRYYRYDGKGDIPREELEAFDRGAEMKNYAAC